MSGVAKPYGSKVRSVGGATNLKPFSSVAIPHRDILEHRLTMDVFAADLWQVFTGKAPAEYLDPQVFFRKTYVTAGLKNLLELAQARLSGKGGDSIIQLQTPFGGGKTHTLIALYHKAKEWGTKTIVIDGTALDPKDTTIWEEIERQLTGKVDKLKGRTSPGREKMGALLEKHQPVLILVDELLHYSTKAAGVQVGGSTLAAQVLAFTQELTGTIKSLDRSLLIITLPSSILERYDESAETLFQQLQKITGRTEKVYTPVQDEEICDVIKRRLFTNIDEKAARDTVEEFLDYAEKEDVLPERIERSAYRDRFIKSYPFQPEVVDILYKRWGSFPTFQRTRGVLRLLSLVVYSLKDLKSPFIRLADFDLSNEEIKRELIKHIGPEYSSVVFSDITANDSGAKKVDASLGRAYSSFSFGTKVATAIFLSSFSGGPEKGATIGEVKLSSAEVSTPSSIIVEAVSKLKQSLFFIQENGKLYFTNQPNLNRVLLTKVDGIDDEAIRQEERNLLTSNLRKDRFELFLWPSVSRDIPDTKNLKLIVHQDRDEDKIKELLENSGERPRVYRNTLIFLCPMSSEKAGFVSFLKRKLAWQMIEKDKALSLTTGQRSEVKENIKNAENSSKETTRNLYRIVLLAARDGFKEVDLGRLTYGAEITIDKEIFERLKNEGDVLEKLAPLIVREKYLKGKDYVETWNILESFYKTPGEMRVTSDSVLRDSIKDGVRQGLFGLGDLLDGKPNCRYFRAECSPELVEKEILIRMELCGIRTEVSEEELQGYVKKISEVKGAASLDEVTKEIPLGILSAEQKDKLEAEVKRKRDELKGKPPRGEVYHTISLKLNVPSGKMSDITRIVNYIKTKFSEMKLKVEISAQDGEIKISDYDDKVKEAISQASMIIEEEGSE